MERLASSDTALGETAVGRWLEEARGLNHQTHPPHLVSPPLLSIPHNPSSPTTAMKFTIANLSFLAICVLFFVGDVKASVCCKQDCVSPGCKPW